MIKWLRWQESKVEGGINGKFFQKSCTYQKITPKWALILKIYVIGWYSLGSWLLGLDAASLCDSDYFTDLQCE